MSCFLPPIGLTPRALALCAAFAISVTGCFAGKGDKDAGKKAAQAKNHTPTQHFGDTGIIFTFPQKLQKSSITIRLAGVEKPDIKALSPDDPSDLAMAVRGLAAGSYDAYITAKEAGNGIEHAAYIAGIKVSREEFANYNLTHFAPSSTLKGQVRVLGQSQHDKVKLAINGIPVTSTTGEDGRFTAPFLPAGSYDMSLSRADLQPGRLSQVAIDGQSVDLGTIVMKKAVEFSDLVTIHDVKPGADEGMFQLSMVIADTRPDAEFIKFNHQNAGWDGIAWRPFRTSLKTLWQQNATNQLYILIADKNKSVLVKKAKTVQMQPATATP